MISEKSKKKRKPGIDVDDLKKTAAGVGQATPQPKKGNVQKEKLKLREGSGVVVLYRKTNDGLKSVAVVPVKSVSDKAAETPGWTQIQNLLMPYQYALSHCQPMFPELLKFGAYKRKWRLDEKSRSSANKTVV